MRIGELAERAGVTAKTVRFYEDEGLLAEPARTPAGYRDYDPVVLDRLAFIYDAQCAASPCARSGRCSTSGTADSRRAGTSGSSWPST